MLRSRSHNHSHDHQEPLRTSMRQLTFKQYLRRYWSDWVLLVCTAALGFGLYVAPPAPNRLFPVYYDIKKNINDNQQTPTDWHTLANPENAYPIKKEIIPMWLSAFLSFIFSFLTFLIAQYWKRSWVDFHSALMGLFYSLGGSGLFQVFCKWLIGGFRPHFLEVCKPDLTKISQPGQGYDHIYYDRSVCTGDEREINDSLQSFPSGHSNAAWAGLLFLFFYLNANLKLYSHRRTPYWKLLATTWPILAASLISLTRLLDYTHHWYDIFIGMLIGCAYAILSWRMQYASIFNWRINHIPLDEYNSELDQESLPYHNRLGSSEMSHTPNSTRHPVAETSSTNSYRNSDVGHNDHPHTSMKPETRHEQV